MKMESEQQPIEEAGASTNAVEAVNSAQVVGPHKDLVPESLLSLAKDARYIQQCQALLKELLEPLFLHSGGDRGQSLISRIEKDSWVLSSLLYIVLVVVPNHGRSMGMDSLGLSISKSLSSSNLQRRKLVVGVLLLSTYGSYAFQRWLQRKRTITTAANAIDRDTSNNHPASHQETLRGADRRRMHEALRQQMLQRSRASSVQNNQGQSTPTVSTTAGTVLSPRHVETHISSIRDRFWSGLVSSTQFLSETIFSTPMEGPHSIIRGGGDLNVNTVGNNGTATQQRSSAFSMGMWIIRLHLAQYCITGKYPSWFHRLAGLSIESATEATNHRNEQNKIRSHDIPCRPTLHRSVGLLIGIQAGVTLFRTIANRWTYWVADQLEERQRVMNSSSSKKQQQPAPVSRLFSPTETSTLEQQQQQGVPAAETTTCAICRMDRSHPAAPSSCGHVFCWNCLIQWVSTVRPECPLCRSPCRPQDMIALYDYGLPPPPPEEE